MGKSLFDLINIDIKDVLEEPHVDKVSRKDIAIIGIGLKLPFAKNACDFWENIKSGRDCIRSIPELRKKDLEKYLSFKTGSSKNLSYEHAAYIEDIDKFDYAFFNISPKEASLMDPNQRLFLETAWGALEDAGYGGKKIVGSKTGVYVGYSSDSEYRRMISEVEPAALSLAVTGNLSPIIASRISYILDLKGPSLLVNTACSSSLVSVHLACQGIRNEECDMALAGGVQVYLLPVREVDLGIESSNARTRSFDDSSDGTGGGEGIGVVLLKPLEKALKDKDHIYAIIKGSSINQDGASIGISAPNPLAQEKVITSAWKEAGINPETLSYIEAHGTGTKIGDPIEIDGLQKAFKTYTSKKQFCAIGSVKSNIGHLDAASGIAGLLKAVMALKHGEIPPSLHFERPNRKISFHKSPFYVNEMLTKWETDAVPRRCGVSSFGFSGTNCHLVLEEAPVVDFNKGMNRQELNILTLSAKTKKSLEELLRQYKKSGVEAKGSIKDICCTANTGRGHYSYRIALILEGIQDFANKIDRLIAQGLFNDPENGIFYAQSKIAPEIKAQSENGERTLDEKKELDLEANMRLQEYKVQKSNLTLLKQICTVYVNGGELDWEVFHEGSIGNRISLPSYPFERKRCWLNIPGNSIKEDELYHYARWKLEELQETAEKKKREVILLLKGDTGTEVESISTSLKDACHTVIEASISENFEILNEDLYTVTYKDFDKLISNIKNRGVTKIVHLVSLSCDTYARSVKDLERNQEKGVYSLFYLTKALLEHEVCDIDIVLVAENVQRINGMEKKIVPENAALFGLGKTVNMENFYLKCRCIDMDLETGIEYIIQEIQAGYSSYSVAYRNSKRYIEEITEIDLPKVNIKKVSIRQDGVYIITGGTGGLGLEIAKHLASKGKVNLALINRTPIPDHEEWDMILINSKNQVICNIIKDLREIENKGSSVVCYSADVSNELEIIAAINYLKNRFGKINGIIHCAGVGAGLMGVEIKNDTEEIFKKVMAPKVKGTWVLERATEQEDMDFFVVFSSPITLVGGVGAGSYTAANSYLDSFTDYRNGKGKRTISMSWAPWENTVKTKDTVFNENKQIFKVLSTTRITEAFDEILKMDLTRVIIGSLNYESEIFNIDDLLPFKLSSEIKAKVLEKRECKLLPFKEAVQPANDANVKLTGRKNEDYTNSEIIVAKILGQVLGYKEISIFDNFFELGGDSIIAMKVINNINKEVGVEVKITDILKNPFIKSFAQFLSENSGENKQSNLLYQSIVSVQDKDCYELSPAQKRIFALSGIQNQDVSWNMSWAMVIEGSLDIDRFDSAFKNIVKAHEILRTSFGFSDTEPVQRIQENIEFRIDYSEGRKDEIKEMISSFIRPFDLSKAPLLRAGLIKLEEQKYLFLFDIHHIIADASSMQVIVNEVVELYKGTELTKSKIQYKDYSEWQNRLLKTGGFKKQEEFWLELFSGEIPILDLPVDFIRPEVRNFEGEKITFELNEELTASLNRLATDTNTTMYMVLMAVFNVLLSKHSGQEDIVVGSPIAGRGNSDVENLIGMFVNAVALRNYPKGSMKFRDFLKEVKKNLLEAYDNQDYPFIELVNKLNIKREPGRNPLFDVSLVMQNTGNKELDLGENLKISNYKYDSSTAKNDILIEAFEDADRVHFIFEYSTKLFKKESIQRMIDYYIYIIGEVSSKKDIKICEIEFLSKEKKQMILNDFNDDL